MTASIQDQLRDYADQVTSHSVPVDLDEIVSGDPPPQPVTQTVGAWPEHPTEPMVSTRRRGWLVAAATAVAVLTFVGGVSLLPRVTGTGAPEAGTVGTPLEASTPTTVADSVLPTVPESSFLLTWSRVPDHEAVFGASGMASVTAGGPGLVGVGQAGSDEEAHAAAWTSVDGITWSRVPDDEAVFGGGGMVSVTAGGPGLVAVGVAGDGAAVWTSVDGITWSRVPDDEAVFGGAGMESVTAGGPGLVAVGLAGWPDDADAVVWTSVDGITWSRVPHDEAVFGGANHQEMFDVTAGGPGLVAVGRDGAGPSYNSPSQDAAVWTSLDGITWSRVPHDEALFGRHAMLSVASDGRGLVAVGDGELWTSPDGVTWSRFIDDEGVFVGGCCLVGVTAGGPGFVVVGGGGAYLNGDRDGAVWVAAAGD